MGQLSNISLKGAPHYITSSFGWRTHPITGAKTFHEGTDYGTNNQKLPIYGIEIGEVVASYNDKKSGNIVIVQYGRLGIQLLYIHLDIRYVKKGDYVFNNTLIGTVGTTGTSTTGIHLHLGARTIKDLKYIDPETFKIPPMITTDINKVLKTSIYDLLQANYTNETIKAKTDELTAPGVQLYKILKDDNLPLIAKKTGTTVQSLIALNDIADPTMIYVGDILRIR